MRDPQQEIFTAIKLELERKGYQVFDGALPPENTPYPFIYLGDVQQIDEQNKTAVFGNVLITVHVWHNQPTKRGTMSNMLLDIKTVCRNIETTATFGWCVKNITQRILPDSTTKTPLMHGVLDIEFKFS